MVLKKKFYVSLLYKEGWYARDTVCVWQSEDNLQKLLLSLHRVGPGIRLRLSGLVPSYWP